MTREIVQDPRPREKIRHYDYRSTPRSPHTLISHFYYPRLDMIPFVLGARQNVIQTIHDAMQTQRWSLDPWFPARRHRFLRVAFQREQNADERHNLSSSKQREEKRRFVGHSLQVWRKHVKDHGISLYKQTEEQQKIIREEFEERIIKNPRIHESMYDKLKTLCDWRLSAVGHQEKKHKQATCGSRADSCTLYI